MQGKQTNRRAITFSNISELPRFQPWLQRQTSSGRNTKTATQWRIRKHHNIIWCFFLKYAFAYPVTSSPASTVAKIIMHKLCEHLLLPTTLLLDKRSAFDYKILLKSAQCWEYNSITGVLERTHASAELHIEAATGDFRNQWHVYIKILQYLPTTQAGCSMAQYHTTSWITT